MILLLCEFSRVQRPDNTFMSDHNDKRSNDRKKPRLSINPVQRKDIYSAAANWKEVTVPGSSSEV